MKEPGPWRAEDGLKLLGSPGLGAWLTAEPQPPLSIHSQWAWALERAVPKLHECSSTRCENLLTSLHQASPCPLIPSHSSAQAQPKVAPSPNVPLVPTS